MNIENLPIDKRILLFDSECLFCNFWVNQILKRDKKNIFLFASLSSDSGKEILKYLGISKEIDSVVYYHPKQAYYIKSDAALYIIKELGLCYLPLFALKILPNSWRDKLYDFIAKNRYHWFGKSENCQLPSAQHKQKFI